jgi:hypothetical protein
MQAGTLDNSVTYMTHRIEESHLGPRLGSGAPGSLPDVELLPVGRRDVGPLAHLGSTVVVLLLLFRHMVRPPAAARRLVTEHGGPAPSLLAAPDRLAAQQGSNSPLQAELVHHGLLQEVDGHLLLHHRVLGTAVPPGPAERDGTGGGELDSVSHRHHIWTYAESLMT